MAVPSSYTSAELKTYMDTTLGAVATALGFTTAAGGAYEEPVVEALLAYGADDIASATDVRKLRSLARVEVWRIVMNETTGDFNFAADGGRYDRVQLHENAAAQFKRAQIDALPYDDGYAIEKGTIEVDYDPYTPPA